MPKNLVGEPDHITQKVGHVKQVLPYQDSTAQVHAIQFFFIKEEKVIVLPMFASILMLEMQHLQFAENKQANLTLENSGILFEICIN